MAMFLFVPHITQIFLLTDVLFAFLKREFALVHGMKPVDSDGKLKEVALK